MKTVRRFILLFVILLAAGVAFAVARRSDAPVVEPVSSASPPKPADPKPSIWTGSPSCVGRTCHGGLEPRMDGNCLQNEYTTISTQDPHARAYQVLFEKRSQDMVRALGHKDGKAHEAARCLACHATPLAVAEPKARLDVAPMDWSGDYHWQATPTVRAAEVVFGVGCESCHEPAARWIDRHYESGWKERMRKELVGRPPGSQPTALDDASVRATTCASCHVGAPPSRGFGRRDVDHDLIAAGHPRLLFEFVSLQAAMPAHWKTKPRDVTFDWFVGQIEGARAAMKLLRHRAETATDPWPEFAEFDCFACHHDLRAKSWRQRVGGKRPPGELPWDSWNASVIVKLLDEHNLPTDAWRRLRDTMPTLAPMDRKSIVEPTRKAEESLDQLVKFSDQWHRDKGGVKKLLAFLERPDWATIDSWEAAEQYFFALGALKAVGDDPDLARRVDELQKRRGFEADYVSPRRFDPREFFKK